MNTKNYYGFSAFPFPNLLEKNSHFFLTSYLQSINHRFENFLDIPRGVGLLTGEIGSGKSSFIRYLIHSLPSHNYRVFLLNSYPIKPRGFYRYIAQLLDLQPAFQFESLQMQLQETFSTMIQKSGTRPFIIFDEAQNLSDAVLESARLMLEYPDPPLLLFLAPSTFKSKLKLNHYAPLRQRLTFQASLEPLARSELESYVSHHLKIAGVERNLFEPETFSIIFNATRGIPRLINQLCRDSLLIASDKDFQKVPLSVVEEVILMDS